MNDDPRWTLITKHGLVLIFLARNSDCTVREISDAIGITPRQTFRIVKDLVADGYLTITKAGRRNTYALQPDKPMRHPILAGVTLGDLLEIAASRA
jgi:hypothetical protein